MAFRPDLASVCPTTTPEKIGTAALFRSQSEKLSCQRLDYKIINW